jgi:hypothetical protein
MVIRTPAEAAAMGRASVASKRQRAAEDERARREIEAGLVAGLGHAPNAIEATVIEQIAARTVRGRHLRRLGRDDTEQSRLVAQLLRRIGMPAAPQQPDDSSNSAAEWLASFKKAEATP